MIVLDANVLIAFSNTQHPFHIRARDVLALGEACVHPLTAAEYLVAPARAGCLPQAEAWLRDQARVRVVRAHDLDEGTWPARLASLRAETKLKMPEVVVLATALALGGKVASFDDALRAAAQQAGGLLSEARVDG